MNTNKTFSRLLAAATLLALVVVVLGAYTRLSDAGLGCPDWPGCYGKLVVPEASEHVDQANAAYPERPLESGKAWKEMVHRYAAGTLGLLIFAFAFMAWRSGRSLTVPLLMSALVIFQAVLGMWTVTLLLKPLVVTSHLIGGMSVLALLYWLLLREVAPGSGSGSDYEVGRAFQPWAVLGLAVVGMQIILGGWISANYAALICPDFPTCRGQWWPEMDFIDGFTLWRGLGVNYEFGVLDAPAQTAIHISHRIGAVITLLVAGFIAIRALTCANSQLRWAGGVTAVILTIQFTLGVANIVLTLPLPVAVAHNGVGALLLLSMVTLLNFSIPARD